MKITKKIVFITFVLALAACSKDKSRIESAEALVGQAREYIENHQYDSALEALDTLDIKYRDCLEQRRQGTSLRLNALADMTRDSIAADHLALRSTSETVDSLAPLFRKIDIAGTNGYFVEKSIYTGSEMNSTSLQPRVDEEGYCYIAATVYGRRIGLNAIRFGNIEAHSQSVAVEGSEIMSVGQESAESLFAALAEASAPASIELVGSKGSVNVTLNSKQLTAFRNTLTYSRALHRQRALMIRLEKFERQLIRLSDQMVNLPDAEQ